MTDRDPELLPLLARARVGMSPTADDVERVHARISASLLRPAGMERGAAASGSVAARALRWTRLRWLALGLGAGGLGGYVAGQAHSSAAPAAVPQVAAAASIRMTEPAPAAPAVAAEQPRGEPPQRTTRAARSDAGAAPKASLRPPPQEGARALDEVAMMQRVNRALARGEAAWALSLLRQLDLELPRGRLLEERAAGAAIARCLLDAAVGESELAGYAERFPGSVHLPRVSQICTRVDRQ